MKVHMQKQVYELGQLLLQAVAKEARGEKNRNTVKTKYCSAGTNVTDRNWHAAITY